MSNPFEVKFDSKCQECEDYIPEGTLMYAVDDRFICKDCAEEANNICSQCDNYKKEEYQLCYECSRGYQTLEDHRRLTQF